MSSLLEFFPAKAAESMNNSIEVRPASEADYEGYLDVVGSAWPGLKGLQEHDFIAKVTMGNIIVANDDSRIVGFSDNVVGINCPQLMIHMIATHSEVQGQGVGNKLMERNFAIIRSGQLPSDYQQIVLTSDPLEVRNVKYYLHRHGFVSNTYYLDKYKKVAGSDSSVTHAGLPQDRFLYSAMPNGLWSTARVLPSRNTYELVMNQENTISPDSMYHENSYPVVFVEVPTNLQAIKAISLEQAIKWRNFHRGSIQSLFDNGYTAVDHTIQENDRTFMVMLRDFDPNNPTCLKDAVMSIAQ